MADWPGHDQHYDHQYAHNRPPVVLPARPAQHFRPRQASEHYARQPAYYTAPDGRLVVPAPGPVQALAPVPQQYLGAPIHRSHSAASNRPPPQVVINQTWDEHEHRPHSSHRHSYYEEEYPDEPSYSPRRERSRSRSRGGSPYRRHYDYETEKRLKRLEELEKREREEQEKKKIEEELLIEKVKEEAKKAARKKEEEELKKKAIEEYNIKQKEKEEKAKEEKKKADEEYKERMQKTLRANGLTEEQIEQVLKKGEGKDKGKGKAEGHEHHGSMVVHDGHAAHGGHGHADMLALTMARPTHIKVNRKHLEPETLDLYQLPWDYDPVSFKSSPRV